MIERTAEELQRQRYIDHKRVFNGSEEGKRVLLDLMNRNFILNPTKGDLIKEGRREAILELLELCHIDINKLDELLKGE